MEHNEMNEFTEDTQPQNKKKGMSKVLYYGLLAFFAAIFIFSAIYIGDYLIESLQAGQEYENLQNQYQPPSRPPITQGTESTDESSQPSTDSTGSTENPGPQEPTILPELQPFYDQNKDTVGWISIPDTDINYPVVQSPDRPDYYLNHTFEKKYNDRGAIYVREQCDVFAPSDNITIYGHHMKTGYKYSTMFRDLDGYKRKSFWENHQYIYFDTLYERHTYQVIAAFKTSANYGQGFAYHLFDNAQSPEEFDQFIATIKDLAYYETGISAQYGDKLITLSTCEYSLDNGRHVVIAKRVA